jgi:phosphate transport system permease protein
MAVIASVIAILFLIAGTTLPLFRPGRTELLASAALPAGIAPADVVQLDVQRSVDGRTLVAVLFTRSGNAAVMDLRRNAVTRLSLRDAKVPPGPALREVQTLGPSTYGLLWSDGEYHVVEVKRTADAWKANTRERIPPAADAFPLQAAASRPDAEHLSVVFLAADNRLWLVRQVAAENLAGDVVRQAQQVRLDTDLPGKVSALALDNSGRTAYAGTTNGCLLTWQIDDQGTLVRWETIPAFRDGRAITALALLLGDVTLAVGDGRGGLSTWLPRRYTPDAGRKLMAARTWPDGGGPVQTVLASGRSKSLLAMAGGTARLYHATSGRQLLTVGGDQPLKRIAWNARGDAALGLSADGHLTAWQIVCPHPEVSWQTLFGHVLYEGYDEPAYVWQTTGGEDYEPKFSLVPLLFGTLKGTLYAMLLAAPLGLFGAIYVSHFTVPGFRRFIKPAVEIMAALPSVVIGFLAALWLAPIVERYVLAVFACLVTVPLALVLFLAVWRPLRRYNWARRVEHGYEFLAVLPVIVAGILAAVWLAGPLEQLLFDGNFRLWLNHTLHARYDQRNNIVIAFGLGLAVIPIIFSLADDALSNVPHNLTAASLAMGASRWQTLWRVVLPSASPGIFAAMMIGFGRAVGETMIVLMATGNTPLLDWSPLNGMRTLSANIAVEIPEAPVGGTLFRVLFLCAVLLFLLTFTLNTLAEVVRQRLRRRYGRY